jgi:hypothetical protein
MDSLRDCMEEKGAHYIGFYRLGRREMVYFGFL